MPPASQPVFTFVHPNVAHPAFPKDLADNTLGAHSKTQLDNSRYTRMEFDVAINTTLHGFAGYFDCKLYKDVHISMWAPSLFFYSLFFTSRFSLRTSRFLALHFSLFVSHSSFLTLPFRSSFPLFVSRSVFSTLFLALFSHLLASTFGTFD